VDRDPREGFGDNNHPGSWEYPDKEVKTSSGGQRLWQAIIQNLE
jgi:hypothetical protein